MPKTDILTIEWNYARSLIKDGSILEAVLKFIITYIRDYFLLLIFRHVSPFKFGAQAAQKFFIFTIKAIFEKSLMRQTLLWFFFRPMFIRIVSIVY